MNISIRNGEAAMSDHDRRKLLDVVSALNMTKISDPKLQAKADQFADELSDYIKQERRTLEAPY